MQPPANNAELRCWECGRLVPAGEGVMPSSFERECYHKACHFAHVAASWIGNRAGAEIDYAEAKAKAEAMFQLPQDHYAVLEREHLGDPDAKTGIYTPQGEKK